MLRKYLHDMAASRTKGDILLYVTTADLKHSIELIGNELIGRKNPEVVRFLLESNVQHYYNGRGGKKEMGVLSNDLQRLASKKSLKTFLYTAKFIHSGIYHILPHPHPFFFHLRNYTQNLRHKDAI
jgi:hypothetical protein